MRYPKQTFYASIIALVVSALDVNAFGSSFTDSSRVSLSRSGILSSYSLNKRTTLSMSDEDEGTAKPKTLQEFIFSNPKAQEVIRLFMSKGEAGMKVAVANDPEVAALVDELKVILRNSK
eukprot:CAMPEP_0113310208 /NCGR_PEP_ID=MMETSP0010_2-20120614/7948_1 /TAXON_ID=216773 ORGANISM="Corethron hystrix, Strain 308" /NCGR_SAMPLE_ID=MMETSP0010_2 /ASSEMBLY_ACC=CAM_ASM_000155 /LENGTH=119 /DNA_ID=CAMNT_0000165623 /DNA_START=167 /DNA_END=526 /DNA_ORIENTATION=+ /assembly_acc=CAM_ASM_000155